MPFHFCHEEILVIVATIPILKMAVPWLRAKIHKWTGRCPHNDQENKNK